MIIDCISDLHGHFPALAKGDLLIVGGDHTKRDSIREHSYFWHWLGAQKYKKQIFIAGNHDNWLEEHRPVILEICPNAQYLCDSGTEFEGLKIWGSPWTKRFEGMNRKCMAFTVDTDEELAEKWSLISSDVDILITHSPPYCIFDLDKYNLPCGSCSLMERYSNHHRWDIIHPQLHIFGHIHECGGRLVEIAAGSLNQENKRLTKFINASYVNERYEPANKPIRIIL